MRTLALLPFLLLSACIFGGDEDKPKDGGFALGLYELRESFQYQGVFYAMVDQIQFKAAGQYHSSSFLNSVLVSEAQGSYRVEGDKLKVFNRSGRQVNEVGQMGPWEPGGDTEAQVRNITATSFQYWAEAIPDLGLAAGWRTYNRIGNK